MRQSLRALAVHPKMPQRLFVGDVEGHVYLSTNSGQSWQEQSAGLPLPDPINSLAFDLAGQHLYAATDKGLFVTSATSIRWQAVQGLPATACTALAFDVRSPQTLYVGTVSDGVYVSRSAGTSWIALSQGLPSSTRVYDISLDPVQRRLWAATANGAYQLDAQDSAWQARNTGLPAGVQVRALRPATVAGGPSGVIYMGTNQGFFRSLDSGAHWITSAASLSRLTISQIVIDFRTSNARTLYLATSAGAWRSDNAGESWGSIAAGSPQKDAVYALALGSENYEQLYAASNGLYLFPGQGGGAGNSRVILLIVVAFLLYLLLRFSQRTLKNRRRVLVAQQNATKEQTPEKTPSAPDS